jgi:hypothetical protein
MALPISVAMDIALLISTLQRRRRLVMFSKTAIALAATSMALGAATVTPAMANYDRCYENPSATGCPGNYNDKEPFYTGAPSHKGAEYQTRHTIRHHG